LDIQIIVVVSLENEIGVFLLSADDQLRVCFVVVQQLVTKKQIKCAQQVLNLHGLASVGLEDGGDTQGLQCGGLCYLLHT
jgi:hypothetical protein